MVLQQSMCRAPITLVCRFVAASGGRESSESCRIFLDARYKKNELEGKNVSTLMPAPFSQRHNTYLRNYATTEKAKVLNTTREVVAMHQERYVFPISLNVTKVSGSGADAIYMGIIKVMLALLRQLD
jgi:hypothetical protein